MRTAHLWMDRGAGWEPLTPHGNPQAALDEISVEWGASNPYDRPDPAVMRFTVRDNDGNLVGRVASLLGMRVMLQLTRTPTWRDLQTTAPAGQRWRDVDGPWSALHERYEPAADSLPDLERGLCLFEGAIATGTTVTQRTDGTWLLNMYATGRMILADSDTAQGPVSNGRQWAGDAVGLLAEITRRLTAMGLPAPDAGDCDLNGVILAGWKTDGTPSLSDALDQSTSWHPHLVRWHETHAVGADTLTPVPVLAPARIMIHPDGRLTMQAEGMPERDVIDGGLVHIDAATLDVPDPVAGIEHTITDTQDETTVIAYDAGGLLPDGVILNGDTWRTEGRRTGWRPDQRDRDDVAAAINVMNRRLHPTGMGIDSDHVSIDDHPGLFSPQPSLWGMIHNRLSTLVSDDGQPAVTGVWLALHGTLTYRRRDDHPLWNHDFDVLQPLPTQTNQSRWRDLRDWPGTWKDQHYTWRELQIIQPAP